MSDQQSSENEMQNPDANPLNNASQQNEDFADMLLEGINQHKGDYCVFISKTNGIPKVIEIGTDEFHELCKASTPYVMGDKNQCMSVAKDLLRTITNGEGLL